jgi:hypothetical protein
MALDGNDIFDFVQQQNNLEGQKLVRALLEEVRVHFLFLGESEQEFIAGIESSLEFMVPVDAASLQKLKQLVVALRARVKEANGPIR